MNAPYVTSVSILDPEVAVPMPIDSDSDCATVGDSDRNGDLSVYARYNHFIEGVAQSLYDQLYCIDKLSHQRITEMFEFCRVIDCSNEGGSDADSDASAVHKEHLDRYFNETRTAPPDTPVELSVKLTLQVTNDVKLLARHPTFIAAMHLIRRNVAAYYSTAVGGFESESETHSETKPKPSNSKSININKFGSCPQRDVLAMMSQYMARIYHGLVTTAATNTYGVLSHQSKHTYNEHWGRYKCEIPFGTLEATVFGVLETIPSL